MQSGTTTRENSKGLPQKLNELTYKRETETQTHRVSKESYGYQSVRDG